MMRDTQQCCGSESHRDRESNRTRKVTPLDPRTHIGNNALSAIVKSPDGKPQRRGQALSPEILLNLQNTVGNRAVVQLLQRRVVENCDLAKPSKKNPHPRHVDKAMVTRKCLERQGYILQSTQKAPSGAPYALEHWVHPDTGDKVFRHIYPQSYDDSDQSKEPGVAEAQGTCLHFQEWWERLEGEAVDCFKLMRMAGVGSAEYRIAYCRIVRANYAFAVAIIRATRAAKNWTASNREQLEYYKKCIAEWDARRVSGELRDKIFWGLPMPDDEQGNPVDCEKVSGEHITMPGDVEFPAPPETEPAPPETEPVPPEETEPAPPETEPAPPDETEPAPP
jgi:hypothetical protein